MFLKPVLLINFLFQISFVCYSLNEIYFWNDRPCLKNEYFNVKSLNCSPCDSSKFLIPASDKRSCVCNKQSIQIGWRNDGFPLCKLCKQTEIPTRDSCSCISCGRNITSTNESCFSCEKDSIYVERSINGALLSELVCVRCSFGTQPDPKQRQCIPCHFTTPNCSCPLDTHDLHLNFEVKCLKKGVISTWPKSQDIYEIAYESGKIPSQLLYNKLLPSVYKCKMNDAISCQFLSNMCVLNLYQDTHVGGPCRSFKDSRKFNDIGLPWIYFSEGEAQSILSKKTINTRFMMHSSSQDSYLNILLNEWSLNGSLLGQKRGLHNLNLCSVQQHRETIRFASEYSSVCYLNAKDIAAKPESLFYDIYLQYNNKNKSVLYAIPVLIENYKHHKKYVNKVDDISQWQLTRRLFVVDNVGGYRRGDNTSSIPNVLRFLQSATLSVKVRDGIDEGMIYPPLLTVSYSELTKDDFDKNINVKVSLRVKFYKNENVKQSFDIALGVLCSVSVIWSCMRTWSNTKRGGQRAIDLVTVLHLCISSCGHLSNVFFLVSTSAAIHSFIYYKWQIVAHVLLPSPKLMYLVRTYIIVAFPLKVVEVLNVLWHQINIDIFLIDWEQPRIQKQQTFSVSAWRTYFVSNKWNEIQTERKTNVILHFGITVLFLKVWGIENWAIPIPELHRKLTPEMQYYNSSNKIHRFAIGVIIYIIVYIVQCAFVCGVYERYIKNPIQEFVDICSLANISVFILSLENFGFYIHGRSVHGFSDTDMATLKKQLRREEEDLVGHRGLLAASDHQTFKMLIPPKLRLIYRSLLAFNPNVNSNFHISTFSKDGKNTLPNLGGDFPMQSYVTINRFLAAFIEHALKDLDYEVQEKSFIEAVLDVEFGDFRKNGILYTDNGHSFDSVLYYGNEFMLFTFDLVLFSFVEILSQDFLLAAVITILCSEVLSRIRRYGGRKNFSTKTLIDEQFLL